MQRPRIGAKILILVVSTLIMIAADWGFGLLSPARGLMAEASMPLYWLTDAPGRAWRWFEEVFVTREHLLEENRRLRSEALVLRGRSQRLAVLAAENVRLRELLNSTAQLDQDVLVAEVIGVSPDAGNQTVMIDKGNRDGLRSGLVLIDAYGLIGQLVEVNQFSSRALLITDARHSVPAEVLRNGVRVIADGTGRIDLLNVDNVAATMDVRPGDVLVSSGLGQRFPRGYPVAVVESVASDPARPFSSVTARPAARIDRIRHVLIVIPMRETALRQPEPQS